MKQKSLSENGRYQPTEIEPRWQTKWVDKKTYHPDIESSKKPYYSLMMFPYPSAEGMHVGNMYAFTGSDIHGRFKRMQGYDVLEPIGLDGFGIHSENYALKIGRHPMDQAEIAEKNFYRQLLATGNSFDWERKVETYNPDYYRWTQWLFTELFKAGLAYRKNAPVNFCPSCKTVLADEQVEDGKCERCSSVVQKKDLEQWFFRITEYADDLLENIPDLNWSEKVKIAQKKWIGKKQGITIRYAVEGSSEEIPVFTTRPDTNFGATFIALAPENPLALKVTIAKNKANVDKYIDETKKKSTEEGKEEGREKTGVFTGAYARNPLTGYNMPIWVSDFVLKEFGTGAVVGVPAHDKRDFDFAQKFGLEVIRVVTGENGDESAIIHIDQVQEEAGTMINSGFLNGLEVHAATEKIMTHMEEKGYGTRESTYHLRDWLISRQRYWGAPIPMIHCDRCEKQNTSWFDLDEARTWREGKALVKAQDQNSWASGWYPAPEKDLPVTLPHIDNYKPLGTGNSPLASYPDFYETICPGCGGKAKRETDVCDTFLDSSWYFFRYTATDIKDMAFDTERANNWLPVNMYIGGAEHSVLHLLYSRFVTMVLKDLGYVKFDEPFARFYAHGLLIKEGAKMSKSKGNVIVPDEYIKKYGADTLRTYLMFLGPYDMGGDFYDSGIAGIYKFLKRVWRTAISTASMPSVASKKEIGERHSVIKAITSDLEGLRYNTAIAKLMTFYNSLSKREVLDTEDLKCFLQLLAPFAPHMTEELWQRLDLGTTSNTSSTSTTSTKSNSPRDTRGTPATRDTFSSIHLSAWPKFDESLIEQKEHVIAIQINGKLRGSLQLDEKVVHDQEAVVKLVQAQDNIRKHLLDKKINKTIYIPGKVVNFVIQ